MPSRQKKLRIPAALAFALLSPGSMSCSSARSCDYCEPLPDAGIVDAGASACTGPDDPRLTDPRWACYGFG